MKKLLMAFVMLVAFPVGAEENKSAATEAGESVNIRFSPLSFVFGGQVEADFVVHPDWTLGPTLSLIRFNTPSGTSAFPQDFELTGFDVGARANWFNEGAFNSGLYVGPSLHSTNLKVTTKDASGNTVTGTASPLLVTVMVGYGWFWDTFNMMLGVGGTLPLSSTKVTVKDSIGRQSEQNADLASRALEFTLGWKF